jgi:hypothetical protein
MKAIFLVLPGVQAPSAAAGPAANVTPITNANGVAAQIHRDFGLMFSPPSAIELVCYR